MLSVIFELLIFRVEHYKSASALAEMAMLTIAFTWAYLPLMYLLSKTMSSPMKVSILANVISFFSAFLGIIFFVIYGIQNSSPGFELIRYILLLFPPARF